MKYVKIKIMSSFKPALFTFIVILMLVSVKSDLPVHCLAGQIEGAWLFHMSNNDGDNSLKCGHSHPDKNLDHLESNPEKKDQFTEKYQILIQIERPNLVYSAKINIKDLNSAEDITNSQIGAWTMIYDEGFEINIKKYTFFSFSRYQQVGKFTASNADTEDTPGYKSICGKTFLGWYRSDTNSNWGCFWAEKISDITKYDVSEINYDNIFNLNRIPIKSNNNDNSNKASNVNKNSSSISNKAKKTQRNPNFIVQPPQDDINRLINENKNNKIETNDSTNASSIPNSSNINNSNSSTQNYVDFLKNLIQNSAIPGDEDQMSNVPHLDIYFMNNMNEESQTNSNFLEESVSVSLKDKTFSPDMDYVNKVNDPSNNYKWEATIYPEFVGKTYSSMRSLLGNVNSLKSMIEPPPSNTQFIELEVNIADSEKHKAMLDIPSSFTWTNVDGVNYDSPIKKQGECGSCYAIATISVFESRLRIKSNNRIKPILSSGSVIGCSRTNQGCSGGYPYLVGKHGFEQGFVEESCQPYQEEDKICKSFCYEEKVYKAKNYGYVGGYYGNCSEDKMMEEIYKNGPIVVAINATPELYYYKSGIFHSETKKKEGSLDKGVKPWEYTNHAVVAVGWGEEYVKDSLEKFWILKNSWGDNWGEKGYFKLSKGVNMASVEAQGEYVTPE